VQAKIDAQPGHAPRLERSTHFKGEHMAKTNKAQATVGTRPVVDIGIGAASSPPPPDARGGGAEASSDAVVNTSACDQAWRVPRGPRREARTRQT
jgi:hypothetical protein